MYLFFVRQFNDIDHMTPIIWKMNADGCPVTVYCLDPSYDIFGDYRLSFLRAEGVRVGYVYDERTAALGRSHRVRRWISRACFSIGNRLKRLPSSFFSSTVDRLGERFTSIGKRGYNRSRKEDYGTAWARSIIEKTRAKALCFDHINPGRYVVNALVDAAKSLSVPTFALPHGVFIYTNRHVRIGTTEQSRLDKFNCFDYIVTQNTLRRDVLVRAGVENDKIHVLGSARYHDEWMEENRKILPRKRLLDESTTSALKAVFMTTRFAYRIDVERMLATFERLSMLPNLHLVVKPHTRTGKEAVVYNAMPVPNVSDLSSVELCEWADVVLVIGSSILIEPLKLDKPVLYLKYLHENTTQYEDIGACWTISDEEELIRAIQSLIADPDKVPYGKVSVDAFLSEIVYGGGKKKNVLEAYKQFIVNNVMTQPSPLRTDAGVPKGK